MKAPMRALEKARKTVSKVLGKKGRDEKINKAMGY